MAAHHRQSLVRAKCFVQRKQIDIGTDSLNVGEAVWRGGYPIHRHQCPGGMDFGGNFGHGVDVADHVGAVGKDDEAGLVIQQIVKLRWVKLAAVRVNAPFTHHNPRFFQPPPCPRVGFVVLVGDDNFISFIPATAKGRSQHVGVLRGRGTKMYFVFLYVEITGQAAV